MSARARLAPLVARARLAPLVARARLAPLVALAFVLALACAVEAPLEARVVHVKDGDSFSAQLGGERVQVRIFGIDAPEKGQPWSRRARAGLEDRIGGRSVLLQPVEYDKYGRLVAWVEADGECVACAQLADGNVWVYRFYTDDAELVAAEEAARAAGRGLWGLPERERVPPWDWRRQRPRR